MCYPLIKKKKTLKKELLANYCCIRGIKTLRHTATPSLIIFLQLHTDIHTDYFLLMTPLCCIIPGKQSRFSFSHAQCSSDSFLSGLV